MLAPRPQPAAGRFSLPPRRPMAAARRVSLFEREIRVHLGTAAIELLFDLAQVLSEGQTDGRRYYGSTMITLDLERAQGQVRDECDAAAAQRVAALLPGDARVRARARALALAAAAERAGAGIAHADVDLRARAAGARVHLDLDVEGELGEP
jgi:hypothetical protein